MNIHKIQENKRRKAKKKKTPVIFMLFIIFAIIFLIFFLLGNKDNSFITMDDSVEQQIQVPILGTDKTQFYVGEREESVLYVYLSKEIEDGTIDILDKEKNKVTSIDVEDMEVYDSEYRYKEIGITIYEETDMLKSYTAVYDDYESTPLNLYVTPHITKENVELCGEILEDLQTYLAENKIKEEQQLEIACEWLKEDERVSEAGIQQGMVLFSTVDSVMGCFYIQEEDTFGVAYEEDEFLLDQYQNPSNTQGKNHKYDIDTITNSKVLVLRPLYRRDFVCTVEYHAEYGKKIAEALRDKNDICKKCEENQECEQCRRCDVISDEQSYKYLGGLGISQDENDMTDYGIVLYNTHGNVFEKKSGGMQAIYQVGTYETQKEALNDLEILASNDFKDENENKTYTDFYDKFYGLYGEAESYRFIYGENDDEKSVIFHTSNVIMDYYSNKFFDGTMFYFGICYVFQDEVFNQFLLNHGAQCVMGYPMKVDDISEQMYFKKICNGLLSDSKNETYRYYNLGEIENKSKSIDMIYYLVKEYIDSFGKKDQCYYVGNADYFLKGTSTLYGTVKIEKSDGTKVPCTDALLSAYRLDAGEFKIACENIPTNKNGEFALENIRCGVYVIKVTDKNGEETLKTMRFDMKNQDGGEIILKEKMPDYYQYIYENLLPKLGYANMEEMKITATFDDYANSDAATSKRYWDNRTGLVSADIADFNADGILDLVVQYFVQGEKHYANSIWPNPICLFADLYSINESNEIYLVGTQHIGCTSSMEKYHLLSGIIELDGKPYLFVEDEWNGVFTDGGDVKYQLFEFDEHGNWGVKYKIGKSAGGTSEIAYSLWEYDSGACIKETILWADGGYRAFNPEKVIVTEKNASLSDAISYAFSMIGMNAPQDNYSFVKNSELKQSLIYDISGKGDYYRTTFTSELMDKTSLKENLKRYEMGN